MVEKLQIRVEGTGTIFPEVLVKNESEEVKRYFTIWCRPEGLSDDKKQWANSSFFRIYATEHTTDSNQLIGSIPAYYDTQKIWSAISESAERFAKKLAEDRGYFYQKAA